MGRFGTYFVSSLDFSFIMGNFRTSNRFKTAPINSYYISTIFLKQRLNYLAVLNTQERVIDYFSQLGQFLKVEPLHIMIGLGTNTCS
jgi:hypothetical protein